ncbi:MAG: twin transmembrane helix small protein [Alphaproteobacteria bacterium]
MHTVFTVAFIIALVATAGVLFTGIFVMSKGGETNRRYGNKLMRLRVVCQGVALALFALMLLTGGSGS